jgi:hypothetical protein
VDAYPKWQAWMRERQPRLLVVWGKYDLSFDLGEPERYRKDVPNAEVHVLDAGHFALDTAADEIAALVRAVLFITEPIAKYGEIRCYIRDPDGYIIEVGQSTDLTYG